MTFYMWLIIILIVVIVAKIYSRLIFKQCTSKVSLYGKTVLITGASSGIGKETAVDMAARGARVILACRNRQKAQATKDDIIQRTGNTNVVFYQVDFESLESVREFSKLVHENESKLHILINNAGMAGLGRTTTKDGLQITMQVNHFAPFLLTNLLLDLLKKSAPSRIVTVSSAAHIWAILDPNNLNKDCTIFGRDLFNYGNSKLCNILMSNELASKLEGSNVISNSLHPGAVYTSLFRDINWFFYFGVSLMKFFLKSCVEGAQTTIHCAVCEKVEGISGKYFVNCKVAWRSPAARNRKLAAKVWEESCKYVQLQKHEIHY